MVVCSRGVRIIVVWSRTRGAIHMPRTHHQATRGDITTRSAAVPHSAKSSAKHAPPLERLCLCVVLWPSGVWLCFLIRFFARALTRHGKRRARGRVVAKKSRITKKGRCFVLNRADGALP